MLNLDPLKKAVGTLEQAIVLYEQQKTDSALKRALADSVIQRFEYTYELAWKIIQRALKDSISGASDEPIFTRKELFRSAASVNLINSPTLWFDFHQSRNKTAHTYDADKAREVVKVALLLPAEVHDLITLIEKHV